MGIRNRFLIPLIVVFVAVGVSVFFIMRSTSLRSLEKDLDQQFGLNQKEVNSGIAQISHQALEIASLFSRLPEVVTSYETIESANIDDPYDATVQEQREKLREFMASYKKGYKENLDGAQLKLHYHLMNGRSFLRVWREHQTTKGEDLSDDLRSFRKTVQTINSGSHKPISGIEIGRGGFALRGLAPVTTNSGKHLGSVEMLFSFDQLTSTVKTSDRQEFAVLMNKSELEIARSLQDTSKYPILGDDYVLITASNSDLSRSLLTSKMLQAGREGISPVFKKKNYWVKTFPIRDFEGTQVGVFADIRNVGIQLADLHRSTTSTLLILLFALGVVAAVVVPIVTRITNRIKRVQDAANQIALGNVNIEIGDTGTDEIGKLADAFRTMVEALRSKSEAVVAFSNGDLTADVNVASDEDDLGHALVQMRSIMQKLVKNLESLALEHQQGDVEARAETAGLSGAYLELVENVNGAFEAIANPVVEAIGIMNEYAEGKVDKVLRDLPGKQIILTKGLNNIRGSIRAVIKETIDLARSAREGNLKDRGDTTVVEGAYREIVEGINGTLDSILEPINEAAAVLERMAEGDLSPRVTGDYKGDHALIKNHLNQTLEELNELVGQTQRAVQQVAEGSNQVSQSSQSLSQGATEQASALEEISSSMTEIGSQTRLNADNAAQANKLSITSKESAHTGSGQMDRMVSAMSEISESSSEVQKIIKAIDEIAFQTNLLALNAAVEAARAGAHGKGFAVVAEEVRNLAQRSAKAAQETTALIEGSVEKTKAGEKIASETAESLSSIVESITKVTDLIGEIDSASREQAQGIDQVAEALGQVDQVTQSNTASAEESAATAEELSGQASQLQVMLSRFILSEGARQLMSAPSTPPSRKHQVRGASDDGFEDSYQSEKPAAPKAGKVVKPNDVISLDDTDFGGF
ncbi:HAMP domain-containing protein [bacterium]|nr:HAMP domain-containing protein [bacterium]